MQKLLSELRKTIVFFGKTSPNAIGEPEDIYFATGFLVQIQTIFHLVTAKHVVFDLRQNSFKDEEYWVAFNTKSGVPSKRFLKSIKTSHSVNWIFHANPNIDIAIIPFELNELNDDVKVISEELFLPETELKELYDVFFLSFQPGIPFENKVNPIIRNGSISLINTDFSFYIDGSAFPGNSGSPVFLKPTLGRFNDEGSIELGDKLGAKFVGLIGEYLLYQEVAISTQTEKPRIIFEENTGLSKVWSCKFLNELIDSAMFKKQLDSLTKPKH